MLNWPNNCLIQSMTTKRMNSYFKLLKAAYGDRNCVLIVTYTDLSTIIILKTKGKTYSTSHPGFNSNALEKCFEDHLTFQNGTSCSQQIA